MKKWDEQLMEDVEIKPQNQNGLCPMCGSPNIKPKQFKGIYICMECFLSRTEDCINLSKSLMEATNRA